MTRHPATPLPLAPADVTVIISTYEQPAWLRKVLWGYAAQTVGEFRILVADDGSGPETRQVIEAARADLGDRMEHVWHEHRGFRKCDILNRAILAARTEYLIFTDGDCIPRRDFVDAHMRLAERGRFLSGGVVWLDRDTSARIERQDVEERRLEDVSWIRKRGLDSVRYRLRLLRSRSRAGLLDRLTTTRATFNGHNASVWRDAAFDVNGFESAMGYGGLDRAFGERLENSGIHGLQVRHRAVCFHLDHDRPYRNAEVVRRNREMRARIRSARVTQASSGLAELLAADQGNDPGGIRR